MPADEGDRRGVGDDGGRAPADEEEPVEASPEPAGAGPGRQPPDHEQARQGARDPPAQPTGSGGSRERRRGMNDNQARNWAAGAHLASLVALASIPPVFGPLAVWLLKREEHPFVEEQSREALNFQISVLVYAAVGGLAAILFTLVTVGLGILVVLPAAVVFVVGAFVLPIVAAIKASDGENFRYPLTIRVISGPSTHQHHDRGDRY